jgi:hypothetical protein
MLKQEYQMVSGTLKTGNNAAPLNGKVTGDQIRFNAGGTEYQGRISGSTIEGSSRTGGSLKATRAVR